MPLAKASKSAGDKAAKTKAAKAVRRSASARKAVTTKAANAARRSAIAKRAGGTRAAKQIDAVKAAPNHYKVELENEHARVLRIRYGPKEKSPRHSHPATIVIMLADSNLRFHMPDGSTQDIRAKAGEVRASPPHDHAPENLYDSPMEAILVEFKK